MTWAIPDWWSVALLALAALRTYWLVANDTIADRPRNYLTSRSAKIETLLECPWCAGFWISLGWWLFWIATPHWALVSAAPLAISAIVGLTVMFVPD